MGKYFGTDGFRGEANVNLTVEHAFAFFRRGMLGNLYILGAQRLGRYCLRNRPPPGEHTPSNPTE